MFNNSLDLIIITGPNSTGKTTASNYFREWAALNGLPHESDAISDTQSLLESMRLDDKNGGFHHMHDWCDKSRKGHSHDRGEPEYPFMNIDNHIPEEMFHRFFTRIAALPRTGRIWFVEYAGGVNTNPSEEATSQLDYSYAKVKKMLQEGTLPISWLERVRAVIHLQADESLRFFLNEHRNESTLEDIEKGVASWVSTQTILRFFGRDDFSEMEDLFQAAGIPVYSLKNDGGNFLFEGLNKIANELFPHYGRR